MDSKLAARALPRLDEDDRLTPILDHLSKNFATPDSTLADSDSALPGAPINAASIDSMSQHFPLCMRNLHMQLRKNSHLKHYGRLQYTLFLKGIGLTLEDCLIFWRQSFKLITDDVFNKEYRYNVRHAYGDVGGDAIRRGKGYSPMSCQKILTEHPPGSGEAHGCPYRHFSLDNLTTLLQQTGVNDRDVLRGVKEDVEKKRFHIACNRVFDAVHRGDIKRVKEDVSWGAADLDTIVHPVSGSRMSCLISIREKYADFRGKEYVFQTELSSQIRREAYPSSQSKRRYGHVMTAGTHINKWVGVFGAYWEPSMEHQGGSERGESITGPVALVPENPD